MNHTFLQTLNAEYGGIGKIGRLVNPNTMTCPMSVSGYELENHCVLTTWPSNIRDKIK